jgi:hypothetical protein
MFFFLEEGVAVCIYNGCVLHESVYCTSPFKCVLDKQLVHTSATAVLALPFS